MKVAPGLEARQPDERLGGIIKLAVMAVGGQGGGVLTNWIESLARAEGYAVQATSVAGVAQRTGATIYYIEMAPQKAGQPDPVFSLAPAGGDVDILIAAELMEAGRAIMRGFITPDRTVLIASTHRALAVSEKMVPGHGIASAEEVMAAAEIAAKRVVMADMEQAAVKAGSVISASLFGALAGADVLPFGREAFENAIRRSGKGVETSLQAFATGYASAASERAADEPEGTGTKRNVETIQGPEKLVREWHRLTNRLQAWPDPVADMALRGLRKVVDFQDLSYGAQYLDRVEQVLSHDEAEQGYRLSTEAAKYIANAMAYDDIIRVADQKTRAKRFGDIRSEMGVGEDQVMHLTEFLHPRAEEIVSLLPARLGARLESDAKWMARIDRWFNHGRRWKSDRIWAFTGLYLLGGLKAWRPMTRRHAVEMDHLETWLKTALSHLPDRYAMAVEIVKCRRLIKGYSDTHARGLSKYDRVLEGAVLVADREDGPDWVARLRETALQDSEGKALDGAMSTIQSFV